MRITADWMGVADVRDPVLERTWCSLTIRVGESVPTRFHSFASGSVREGVLGSAFPLCRWLVSNWWSLFYESMPSDSLTSGVRANAPSRHRAWFERHGILYAREGFALPDLIMFRDEADLHVSWCEDPEVLAVDARGRFVSSGTVRIPLDVAREAISAFVAAVLDRLEGFEDPEVVALRSDWDATRSLSREAERELAPAAAVGLDPFDLDEDRWTWLERVNERFGDVPDQTADELLAATTAGTLEDELTWILDGLSSAGRRLDGFASGLDRFSRSHPPFLVGYSWARQLRDGLGLEPDVPIPSVEALAMEALGALEVDWTPVGHRLRVDGLVAGGPGDVRVAAPARGFHAQRFLIARAVAAALTNHDQRDAALVTASSNWGQRAGRAFAAELLAPASALEQRLLAADEELPLSAMASEFQVSEQLIHHQVANHRILERL